MLLLMAKLVSVEFEDFLPLICEFYTCDDANFCFRSLALDITGCPVKADARGMDIGITTLGPIDEARHRIQQGLA
jgi:hypothetical protein